MRRLPLCGSSTRRKVADPQEAAQTEITEWLRQALDLRRTVSERYPRSTAGPEDVHAYLSDTVRPALDRLEGLLQQAASWKAGSDRMAAISRDAYEDAWNHTWSAQRNTRRMAEYSTGREREAEIDLAVFEIKKTWRQARSVAAQFAEAERRLTIVYRGVEGTRQDILARLRSYQVLSSLER